VIDLCVSVFDWAKFPRTKGAIKLRLGLDHKGYRPSFGMITEGTTNEVKIAKTLAFEPGTVVVDDPAYNDYRLFADWSANGVYFVIRMKDNAPMRSSSIVLWPKIAMSSRTRSFVLLGSVPWRSAPIRSVGWRCRIPRKNRSWFFSPTISASGPPHCNHLQIPLADRAVFQSPQAEP